MKTTLVPLFAALLAGCAASTPQQARDLGADRRYVFEIDLDYQIAYRRILEAARGCHQVNLITASQIVDGDLYPDMKTGTVTVGMYGALGPQIYQMIDVRGIDGNRTAVTATFPIGPVDRLGGKVRAWAETSSTAC